MQLMSKKIIVDYIHYIINQEPHSSSRLKCPHKRNQTSEYSDWLHFNTMLNICQKIIYMPEGGLTHLEESEVAFYRNQWQVRKFG
jgi:hypothetical protein